MSSNFDKVDFIFLIIFLVVFGFIIGWLFPVEGPYDDQYEQQVVQHKKRSSTVNVAAPKKVKRFIIDMEIEDFMNEEEEYYYIPFNMEE